MMRSRGTRRGLTYAVRWVLVGIAMTTVFIASQSDRSPSSVRRFLNENAEGSIDDEEAVDAVTVSAAVLLIFLMLIALTIGFDLAKEHVEESAGRHMRPILESLFGELTILGFLSLCTFVLAELGVFRFLSDIFFAEEDEDEVLELFEYVHFSLFFVMIIFVIQVLEEVKQGLETEKEWLNMDRYCRDPGYICQLLERKEREDAQDDGLLYKNWDRISPYLRFLPQMRNKADESLDDMLLFYSLREEFIKERSVDPPFRPKSTKSRVGDDFNFGRYLSVCFGIKMAHVIEVDPITWVFFAVFGASVFGVLMAVQTNFVVMSWIWVAIGYSVFLFNVHFETYILNIRRCFSPSTDEVLHGLRAQNKLRCEGTASSLKESNERPFVASTADNSSYMAMNEEPLPAWCFIDIKHHEHNRSWLSRLLSSSAPNRHHALFWLEKNGPKFHVLILRINLVFVGLYTAMLALVFYPTMYKQNSHFVFSVFAIISVVPMLAILFNKKHLISTMVQVGSIGSFRLPQAIAQANREEKTAQCVRTLVIIQKLHRAAQGSQVGFSGEVEEIETHYSMLLNHEEVTEVSKTFDLFDQSGDGRIDAGEFVALMETLGTKIDNTSGRNLVARLDLGGDGVISKEEFLQWYANLVGKHDGLSMKERAHFLFEMFDKDGNGDLTVCEFKETLDALNTNFTLDEVGEVIKELDHNDKGVVGEHEFMHLLERYYPDNLDVQDAPWANILCETALSF